MTPQSRGATTYVRLIAAIALSSVSAWAIATYFNHRAPLPNASPRPLPQNYGLPSASAPAPAPAPSIEQEPVDQTTLAALPALASDNGARIGWDGIQGLRVRPADAAPVVAGQQPLVLAQVPTDGVHRLGMRITDLKAGAHYRVTAWLRPTSAAGVVLDGRDGAKANTGLAMFNLMTSTVLKSEGKIKGLSIALDSSGWVKAAMDLQSSDGILVVYVGLLGGDDSMRFRGNPHSELAFGGITVTEIP